MAVNKLKKKSGVVGDLISGTGGLIILVIIVLVIVSTILGANLLRSTATTTTVNSEVGYINSTGYTLTYYSSNDRSYTIAGITNRTSGAVILSGNYTLSNGVLRNATATTWNNVSINYTYIPRTNYEVTSDSMSGNLTNGLDNVSGKIPTILLIGAVVLLFGVIVLLVKKSQEMGLSGGSEQGSL